PGRRAAGTVLHRPVQAEGSLGWISVRERHAANRTAGPLARTRRRLIEIGSAIKGPNMAQTHQDGDHSHPAAPMVEEISDFEILEIAVRELAIEKGLFTAEDHRKFTEWAE